MLAKNDMKETFKIPSKYEVEVSHLEVINNAKLIVNE